MFYIDTHSICVYYQTMANKSSYWRLSLTIDEVHETLEHAAVAVFGFLTTAPTEQVVLLRQLVSNHFLVVDRDTYFANRSTLKHQATSVVFMGNMTELRALTDAVPPSLFAAKPPDKPEHHPEAGGH